LDTTPTEKETVNIISSRIRKLEKTRVVSGGLAGEKENQERDNKAKDLRNILKNWGRANK